MYRCEEKANEYSRNGTRYANYHGGRYYSRVERNCHRAQTVTYLHRTLINSPRQITLLALETFLHQHDGQPGIPPLVGPSILAVAIVIGPEHDVLRHFDDAPFLGSGIFQTAQRVGLEGGMPKSRLLLAADGFGREPGFERFGTAQDGRFGG